MFRSAPRFFIAFLLALAGPGRALHAAPDLFATLAVEPVRLYEGQPFALTLTIFTTGQDLKTDRPRGFPDNLHLQPFREMPAVVQQLDGRTYQALRFRAEGLAPAPGEWPLAPLLEGVVIQTEQFYFLTRQTRTPVRIPVTPLTLTVLPVPADRAPADYNGLLGAFTLRGTASTNRYQPGDLITLRFELGGSGRFDLAPPLGLPSIEGFRVYPPRRQEDVTGRVYTQVVVPGRTNLALIPAFSLTAFNPVAEQFETLLAGPFPLAYDAERPSGAAPDSSALLRSLLDPEAPIVPPVHTRFPARPAGLTADGRVQAEALFKEGVERQNDARYADAWTAFARITESLPAVPAVLGNMGAAFEGMGEPGKAMLYYLRAARQDPGDIAVRQRLLSLAERRRIAPPSLAWPFSRVSEATWSGLLLLSLAAVLAALHVGRFPARRRLARLALVAAVGAAGISAAGRTWWRQGPPASEAVVLGTPAQARLAPSDAALPTLRLTPGQTVHILERHRDWIRVRAGNLTAWLPEFTAERP